MKRYILAFIILFLSVTNVFSSDVFFPAEKGMVQLTANLNHNGKIENYNLLTIKDIIQNGSDMTVTYTVQILNRSKKPDNSGSREYSVKISNGVLIYQLDTMMDAYFAEKNMKYSISSGDYHVPSDMEPGSRIGDTWMKMTIHVPIIGNVSADVAITDIVCTGIETVTVPAGTFEAYKVTQTAITTTKGWGQSKIVNTRASWFVKGLGVVKSINYDEKGKIDAISELYELTR